MSKVLNNNIEFINTIGFKVFSDQLSKIQINTPNCKVINTISPNSYGITTKDREFDVALKNSDFIVLDGVYFAIASILLKGKNIKKNQGPDVFYYFMRRMNEHSLKAFFLGSSESTLKRIKDRAKSEYPNITVEYFSPPFKRIYSEEENIEILSKINNFQPDILFIGMTCPKQEKWAIEHRDYLKAGLAICIGNVFDWFAGTQKVIHPIWFKLRLGWLIRIFLRPEIFRRNIGNQMIFFWHVLLMFLRIKKYD
jgi:N-acetylglucosaminyldiphosphoundecaprenol N-acetyl-beta-D-mannosaminyltransferase